MVAAMASHETEALPKAQAELVALQAKNHDLADQYLRAKADTENARRRAEDEVSKARKFALESFADSLLPVIDSLEAGLALKEASPNSCVRAQKPHCANWSRHWSATRSSPSIRRAVTSSIRTSTRPSAWCPPSRRPTPWSPCCKRAT